MKPPSIRFPAKLLEPIRDFLKREERKLERRKQEISDQDPFEDTTRLVDNAASDADAAEQFGHARMAAVKGEIERKQIQIRKALTRIKLGSYGTCEVCGEMIDTDRLMIYPETTLCVKHAKDKEG